MGGNATRREARTRSRLSAASLPARRALVARARRALWEMLRERARGCAMARSALRRRLGDFLRRLGPGRLWAILRSAALAASVAATLAALDTARAQEIDFPAIELADVALGHGGFLARGEGQPRGGAGSSVSGAGDVNGDGIPDLVIGGGSFWIFRVGFGPAYVVFGKARGETVELSDIEAGQGGFMIRGSAAAQWYRWSVSGAGDVNGDGLADLLVGAPHSDPVGRLNAGESYVVFGKAGSEAVELAEVQAGLGGFAIRGSAGYDHAGASVSGAGDVNGDGLADLLVGAPKYSYGSACIGCPSSAGKSYVVFGKTGGEAVELAEVEAGRGGFAIRGSAAGDGSGRSVSGAGDVNGDGLQDLLVGAHGANPGGRLRAGESYVVFGKAAGEAVELAEVQAGLGGGFAIRGSAVDDGSGRSVSGAGDVNGDGLQDLLVGAPFAKPGGRSGAGESYVVFGKAGSEAVELAEVQAGLGGFAIRGSAGFDYAGSSVAGAGDVNGDGLADLLVGAPKYCYHCPRRPGESYVVFGKAGGEAIELSEVQAGLGGFAIRGSAAQDLSGFRVSGAGDVNGDRLEDLLIGAPWVSPGGRYHAGESYVVFGKAGGEAVELADVESSRGGFVIRGGARDDLSGFRVSGAGDVNGDGLEDLLVGAPFASPGGRIGAGESHVVFAKAGGEAVELANVEAGRGGFAIRGSAARDGSGRSVSSAGDVNGDGLADVLVGAPGADPGGRDRAGESYVIFGKAGTEAVELSEVQAGRGGFAIPGTAAQDLSGSSVSGAGDVNGDGFADLLVGAPKLCYGCPRPPGESYVVFGKAGGETVELFDVEGGSGGFVIRGSGERDYAGRSVSGAGDVNGDGLQDLVLGVTYADPAGRGNAGESYVVFGKAGGEAVEFAEVEAGRGGFVIRGSAARDYAGQSVSGAGDVNGDGLADVLVGAPGASPGGVYRAGESYVVWGKAGTEAVELAEVEAGRGGFAIRGSAPGDRSGSSVSGVGDVDGDGLADDIIIASGLADARYPSLSSAAYVVFGPRAEPSLPRFRRGAVRGEAMLDISDGIHLLSYLFLDEARPPCLEAADADDSGILDLTDAVRILNYLFLGGVAPPAPGPEACGLDPTADDLGCATPPRGCGP